MKNISNIIIKGSISSISKEERVFSGFGSVQLIDKQGDYLPISEFRPVLEKLMSMGHKIPVQDSHSNHNCGEIVKFEFKNDDGGRPGLYLTAKIYSRYPSDDDIWNCIKNGEYKGFSLGGKAGEKVPICDENGCYNLLKNLELWEFSIVSEPANQSALIDSVNKLAKSYKTYKVYIKKSNTILKYIKRCGDKFCVYSEDGKRLGTHPTEEDANQQLRAIEINKSRIYIQDSRKAPEGAKIQRGKYGGMYYESETETSNLNLNLRRYEGTLNRILENYNNISNMDSEEKIMFANNLLNLYNKNKRWVEHLSIPKADVEYTIKLLSSNDVHDKTIGIDNFMALAHYNNLLLINLIQTNEFQRGIANISDEELDDLDIWEKQAAKKVLDRLNEIRNRRGLESRTLRQNEYKSIEVNKELEKQWLEGKIPWSQVDKGWLSDFGEYVEEDFVNRHFVPGQKPESDWSDKIKELWRKKQEEYDKGKFIHKAKVYVKNPNEAPKGVKVQEGKRGGHYYETGEMMQQTVPPKKIVPPKNKLTEQEVFDIVANSSDPSILNQFIQHPNSNVRRSIALKTNQEGLHKLINDKDEDIRYTIAGRIDQAGLHKMMKDISFNVREILVHRIDQSGLHEMINDSYNYGNPMLKKTIAERINIDGLKKIHNIAGWITNNYNIDKIIKRRIPLSELMNPTIDTFEKTGKIELHNISNSIRNIMSQNSESTEIISLTDEFYNIINNGEFHQFHIESKSAWEQSSSSEFALLLKDSIKRQFGGEIRYHDAVKDIENKLNSLYRQYPRELVDKYVQIQKKLTRAYLDAMFPNTDEITIYRGTTRDESQDILGSKEIQYHNEVMVQSNPLSSWTLRNEIASRFASHSPMNGVILQMKVNKNDIWSTFMSHAYEGTEREILLIGNKDRKAYVFDLI